MWIIFFCISTKDFTLDRLLAVCTDRRNPGYEQGWCEFDLRYNQQIKQRIQRSLFKFGKANDLDSVNEVHSIVMLKFINGDFKALKGFKNRNEENAFLKWLRVVCVRASIAYMEGNLRKQTSSLDDYPDLTTSTEHNGDPRAYYELLSRSLKQSQTKTQKRTYNIERDNFVYLLTKVADFKAKEIAGIPRLRIHSDHIPRVVFRINEKLKKDRET